MKRLAVLDGLRGYFLVFMLITHLGSAFAGNFALVRINHAELGFVQDAQGFIFLSGLLVGLVYTPRMMRAGFGAAASRVWHRALELYAYALGCIAVIVALALVLPHAGSFWDAWLGPIKEGRPAFLAAAALLLYQPTFMDILPQYIVYLLVSPAVIWLCLTGRWSWVMIVSGGLWLAVQLGAHYPAAAALSDGLGAWDERLWARSSFNVLAWQIVFLTGTVLGALTAMRAIDWGWLIDPARPTWARVAAAAMLFFMAWRLAFTFGLVPEAVMTRFRDYEVRAEFGLVFLANFAAAAYLMAWLLLAGPRAASPWVRRIAGWLHALFNLPFLRLLGRHSLQVYAWHVLIVFGVRAADWHLGPLPEPAKIAIGFAAIALLALPAWLRDAPPTPAARPTSERPGRA